MVKDTIPRLQQLVPHMLDQLKNLREGATFEEVRLSYIATVDRLVSQGQGRRTASRVNDNEAYWSPAADVLQEAIRLGFVRHQPLPSARRYLDSYRDRRFELTNLGFEVSELAQNDVSGFFDRLADAITHAHPYFKQFLLLLTEAPLICPEISEGEIEDGRKQRRTTDDWARWAAERINAGRDKELVTVAAVKREMRLFVNRRFGVRPVEKPTSKALAEVLNDAFAATAVRARGVPMGAMELQILRAWGSQLRLLDQSRHVPNHEGSNLVWIASDVERAGEQLRIIRRRVADLGSAVARSVVEAYRRQSASDASNLAAPYLPIYRVRAEAAFECGVTRGLVDIVLEKLANGDFPELGVQVWLHLGRGDQPPPSEPIFRRAGTRRYQITITTKKEPES